FRSNDARPAQPGHRSGRHRPAQFLTALFPATATVSPRPSVQTISLGSVSFSIDLSPTRAGLGEVSMNVRKITVLFALLAVVTASLIAATHSEVAFKKLQSLAGDWEGKDEHGMPVKTSFQVLASKT